MKVLFALFALLISPSVLAQQLDFWVARAACSGGPADFKELQKVKSTWRADGALELVAWASETQRSSVVDGSGRLDLSVPGTIQLFYRTKNVPAAIDAPVNYCEDFVKLTFLVRGIKRDAYSVTIETNQVVLSAEIGT